MTGWVEWGEGRYRMRLRQVVIGKSNPWSASCYMSGSLTYVQHHITVNIYCVFKYNISTLSSPASSVSCTCWIIHKEDNTHHGICLTNCKALAEMRNYPMGSFMLINTRLYIKDGVKKRSKWLDENDNTVVLVFKPCCWNW